MAARSGRIQTVLGLVDPADVGITLPHEHLSIDFKVSYQPCGDTQKETMPFKMENLGWIRQYPYSHKPNLSLLDSEDILVQEMMDFKVLNFITNIASCREWVGARYSHKPNLSLLDSEDILVQEMMDFKAKNGSCIVENSTIGLDRNLSYVQGVSKSTGVHIVAGTGFYVDASRPSTQTFTVEEMTARITEDIAGSDVIKCGVIGEVGCSWPLTASEKRSLQASAIAQSQLGCGVIIHPGRNEDAPAEIARILQEAGGDLRKTVMSHLDRTIHADEKLLEFAKLGLYLEYDLFGIEVSDYQMWREVDMPSDAERIRRIRTLVEAGYGDRVLIAHDIHTKHRLVKYGGHGFCHILNTVVPKMLQRGLSQTDVDRMLIENPRAWMTFK